jgi:hypothetical protein
VDRFIGFYRKMLETGTDDTVDSELDVGGETRYVHTTTKYVGLSKEYGIPVFIHWNEDITGLSHQLFVTYNPYTN